MKKKEKRMNDIMDLIREQPSISVKALAQVLDVSEMTIRRDLEYLKNSSVITQSLGMTFVNSQSGISSPAVSSPSLLSYNFGKALLQNVEVKKRIARKASDLLYPRETIILDSSTTVSMMVPFIPPDMELTVLCSSYHILSQLPKDQAINIIFAGGVYDRKLQMFESPEGLEMIKSHRANKYFFSTSGIHERLGMTCSHSVEVMTKRACLSSSAEKILLADSGKFGVITTSYFAKLTDCDTIITDDGISDDWVHTIEASGIQLYIVSKKN